MKYCSIESQGILERFLIDPALRRVAGRILKSRVPEDTAESPGAWQQWHRWVSSSSGACAVSEVDSSWWHSRLCLATICSCQFFKYSAAVHLLLRGEICIFEFAFYKCFFCWFWQSIIVLSKTKKFNWFMWFGGSTSSESYGNIQRQNDIGNKGEEMNIKYV